MSKKEKLIKKFKSLSKNFTFDDLENLLKYFNYEIDNKGKTSGSRVKFTNVLNGSMIWLHKPHPRKELLEYQLKQIMETLRKEGML